MARFSGSEAIGAGFRIIGKHPGAVVVWGLVYVVLALGPQLFGYWTLWPDVMSLLHTLPPKGMGGDNADAFTQAMVGLRLRMLPYQLLQFPTTILAAVLIYGAVYRAVIEPRASAAAYLRLGAGELWLFLVWVVAFILIVIALIPIILAAGFGAHYAHAALPASTSWLAVTAIVLAVAALILWLLARFSLAYPMSFAEGRFRLFESWGLTRGNGWKIVGLMLALALILILIEVCVGMVVFGIVLAGVGANWQTFGEQVARAPDLWVGKLVPWFIGFMLVYVVLVGVFHAIFVAPFADIYRQLTAKLPGPAVFGEP